MKKVYVVTAKKIPGDIFARVSQIHADGLLAINRAQKARPLEFDSASDSDSGVGGVPTDLENKLVPPEHDLVSSPVEHTLY